MKTWITVLLTLILANASLAADSIHPQPPATHHPTVAPDAVPTAPSLPQNARWVVALIIVVIAMFAAAAVIGPIYRMSLPDEISVNYSHDEPPGSSHHHGPTGTIDFSAPEKTGL